MNKERTRLETAAIAAHRRGDRWADFWPTIAADVAAIEPYDRAAYHRLVGRLSHLLVCGDSDGMLPAGATEPWLDDSAEANKPSDSHTAARLQLHFPEPTA